MMRLRLSIVFMLFIFTAGSVSGSDGVRIFLNSNAKVQGDVLLVGDVASLDGKPADAAGVASIEINPGVYVDGYISRSDLRELIVNHYKGNVTIYGSGVRIEQQTAKRKRQRVSPASPVLIMSGNRVMTVLSRPPIKVEQYGTALRQGRKGETIPVRVGSGKTVYGKVMNSEKVEIE